MSFAISWSRLELYEKCPLLYYYKHAAPKHLRIVEDDNPAFIKGRQYHTVMEKACKGTVSLPEHLAKFKPIVKAIRNFEGTVFVEEQLALTNNYRYCDWFGRSAYWRTIFDVLAVNKHAIALDWKTGKVKESSDQLMFSAAAAMLWRQEIKTIDTYYVWLEHPDVPLTKESFDRKNLIPIVDEFEERVEMVKLAHKNNDFQPTPSNFACKWCPTTRQQCRYSRN